MRSFVESLARDKRLQPHVIYTGHEPALEARFAVPNSGWPAGSREALAAFGIERLYLHQAQALDAVASGQNTLLATPTASGKTLAYLLALLARRAENPNARAIFLYPLKALARDQLGAVRRFLAPLGFEAERAAEVYDGDTPETQRRKIRKNPPLVVITNPDMLHLGLLPSHETWSTFLSHLSLIVVDEAHVYRGIFGAHVHHVLRRALRLVKHHGGKPLLVAGSATIGAPQQFIQTLTGEPFTVVSDCGAPASRRHVIFLSPDMVSPYTVAVHAVAEAVTAGHKTIAFTKARRITELMHQWLKQQRPELAPKVASYRSGYLPEERREIEARLFGGSLAGVISTSALEAGIDVGGLDVCVLVGYPGSLATAWQRIGRTGRSDHESLAILVAMPDALDRFVVEHPQHFFSGEFERVVLDPRNDTVADAHLESAAAELSIDLTTASSLHGATARLRIDRLVEQGKLIEVDGEARWFALRRQPQRDISLRSINAPYSLTLHGSNRPLGSIDAGRAWFEGHPGAIYLHAGQTFRSLALDIDKRTILMEACEVDHYTQVYARKETEILERTAERPLAGATLAQGRVRVTTTIEGFARRRLFGGDEISRHPLTAPPQILETTAFWIELPSRLTPGLVEEGFHPAGSLHAAEHAAIGLFPLLAICDRGDLGGISYARHPQLGVPSIFIYDGWPGGVGLSATGFERAEELFDRTRQVIAKCRCEDGCPACIHSPRCGSGNSPLDKPGAVWTLEAVLGLRPLPEVVATDDELAEALSTHRVRVHGGVRGGATLPPEFFSSQDSRPAIIDQPLETLTVTDSPRAARTAIDPPVPAQPVDLRHDGWFSELPLPNTLLRPADGRVLFFDLETLRSAGDVGGWNNIREMGLALAITLDAASGVYRTYLEDDAAMLVDDLAAADCVVGFNLDRFDVTVLSGYVRDAKQRLKTLDLLTRLYERLGFRVGLGHLAEETFGVKKSGDGLQSLEWVKQGRFDLIESYCRDDVKLTAALWAHGRARGHVMFKNREGLRGKIPVSW
ncbi:MAG: DEAD/DEAH box helicase [Acidobacteriota bacterium]